MARNVVHVISSEHRRIDALLVRAARGRGSRPGYRDEAVALLEAHLRAAREELHPFIALRSPERRAQLDTLLREQDVLDGSVQALLTQPPGTVSFTEHVRRLRELLAAHCHDEDDELRRVARAVEVSRLRELGGAYQRRRDGYLRSRRARATGRTPRRLDVPKADLYEQARRAGIPGRSAMSRDELIVALLAHTAEERHA